MRYSPTMGSPYAQAGLGRPRSVPSALSPRTLAEVLDSLHLLRCHALDGPRGAAPSMASLQVAQGVCERLAGLLGHGAGMPDVVAPDRDGGMVLGWPAVEVGVGRLGVLATLTDADGETETRLRPTPGALAGAVAERVAEMLGRTS